MLSAQATICFYYVIIVEDLMLVCVMGSATVTALVFKHPFINHSYNIQNIFLSCMDSVMSR